ncbi:vWA domain-containing protein [Rubinisphaera margarita]|uniref:vWA domain-containing protein n=1 Tax=Rubinisphaera margarita TaxID=2909586 RepID=UPI001EE7FF18|nr:BatA and WFA domain-containing protein [Rubinisphaera margarita]MCG6156771.1 BatA and WFA domain-containing protein [Rubinisphaera margarita]
MYFANPWGLLGLLSLPVIAIIHLYHRRFPPLQVAGLHLWTQETKKDSPGRRRERLPITRSLILELLAALLISLLLADPRSNENLTRNHLVLVLDDSASMAAVSSGQSSRERALEWIREQEESIGRGGVVSVLQSGLRPTLLAGPRAEWPEMLNALKEWQPQAPAHDFASTWDLGAQLAGEEGRFVFLTDHLPGEAVPVPERMETVSFGRKLGNVAITTARWMFDADTGEGTVYVRLVNFGEDEQEVQLAGVAGDHKVIEETVDLTPGRDTALQWTVPGGLGQLRLTAEAENDPLEIDHQLILMEPEVRLVTVALTLPSDHSAFEPIQRILGVLPQAQLGNPGDADLIVAPAVDSPPAERSLWWLGMGPLNPGTVDETGKMLVGPYLVEKQHPLMNEIVLGGVVWGGVQPPPDGLVPLVSAGSTFLLGQKTGTAANAYIMNIDLAASNLTESPDWPIFWTNLIEQCRNSQPGFRRWNFHLEESIPLTLEPASLDAENDLLLVHEGTEKSLIRMESIEIPPRREVGLYTVQDGETEIGTFAVNFFDREESNLTQLLPGQRQPRAAAPPLGIHLDNPFSWLIVIGILLVVFALIYDWITLRGRMTKAR